MVIVEEGGGERAAEEAGAAGDDDFHDASSNPEGAAIIPLIISSITHSSATAARASGRHRLLALALAVSVVSLLFALGIAELVLRWRAIGPIPPAHMGLHYRHDDLLGWHPAAHDTRTVIASRPFRVDHNSDGFRDREHGPKTKPRMLFLGDSFVWGFDADQRERFTDLVQDGLPGWELINAGVSGYGTDQEYLLLKQIFARYRPDVVFLMFCQDNDRRENSSNQGYGFLKPYFVRDGGELVLKGTPVPKSETYWFDDHPTFFSIRLTRAIAKVLRHHDVVEVPDLTLDLMGLIKRFLDEQHVPLFVGLTGADPDLERYLASSHIAFLTLPPEIERYPAFGSHWTPRGNQVVSRQVLEALKPFLGRTEP